MMYTAYAPNDRRNSARIAPSTGDAVSPFAAFISILFAISACIAFTFALSLAPRIALADDAVVLTYERNGGVSDDATSITIMKLDRETHVELSGASLVVIDKLSGMVMDQWVSTGSGHEIKGVLSINTPYVLRELSAPAGYSLAPDTEFILRSVSNATSTQITSGANAELVDDYRINLYNISYESIAATTGGTNGSSGSASGSTSGSTTGSTSAENVAQTSDPTSLATAGIMALSGLALAGVGVLVIGRLARSRRA